MTDRTDDPARLIAQLLAERTVPRTAPLAQRALIDIDFRTEVERRLLESGLRLLANPFAEHLAVALHQDAEQAVFGQGSTWLNNNFSLSRDGVALLVLLWALIILPKRERQWSREADTQHDMFGAAKPLPGASNAARGIAESTLRADYADACGGWTRITMNLGILSRLGFIERRNKIIYEGPLLDLALDYETLAPRLIDGALGDLLSTKAAVPPAPTSENHTPTDTETLVRNAAKALSLDD
jgi:hypothetical protein